jgi:phosphoribosylformylglycinamidine synthase subunit PurS
VQVESALLAYPASVAKIVVDVMLKPEIRDPQGEAIMGACHRLGFTDVRSVRQGKRFEVEIDDGQDPAARTAELAAELLANPVIEEFVIGQPGQGR